MGKRALGWTFFLASCGLPFQPLSDALESSAAPLGEGQRIDVAGLTIASDRAFNALVRSGVWPRESLERVLRGVRILVQPTETWTRADNGHPVAGIAWLDVRAVEVGVDYAALAHEYAEIAYASLDKHPAACWHCSDWPGRSAIEMAVRRYQDRQMFVEGGGQ